MEEEQLRQVLQLATQEETEIPASSVTTQRTYTPDSRPNITVTETRHETREVVELDPKEYGIEFNEDEFVYEPPERDENLPDLYNLLATLDTGEGSLDTKHSTPSLFTRPENVSKYKRITELKMEMQDDDLNDYVNEFDKCVTDEVLMIGQIALEDVQEEEHRLRDEHIAYQEQEAHQHRVLEESVLIREEEAKKRFAKDIKDRRSEMRRRHELMLQQEKIMLDRLHKSFRRSENQLLSSLEKRKGEVKTYYGDLTLAEGHYGGSRSRRWKVDWELTPQPVQVKLKCLRGVKDKLPGGRYVVMASLYNRLGGHVMRWSNLKGQQWGGATLPTHHEGHFYNAEIKLDQSVFTVLPSKPSVRPGMVLVFEVFLLRGSVVQTDRVVGWGAFPIANAKFEIVEGKFKCPLLRGEMDTLIDKHEKIEALVASELDHWLCNLYFEIIRLPRYLAGQKEYEVELQFSSGMLNYPDRVNTGGEEYRDGEAPIPGSLADIKSNITATESNSRDQFGSTLTASTDSYIPKKPKVDFDDLDDTKPVFVDTGKKLSASSSDTPLTRPMSTYGSKRVHKDKKAMLDDSDDSDEFDDSDVYVYKKDDQYYPVKGEPGLYYRKHLNNPVDHYHKKFYTLLPKTPVLTPKQRRKRLTHLEELEQHTFSVRNPMMGKGQEPRSGFEKVEYVSRMLLSELGLSEWRSREFWGMIFIICLLFFLRVYVHYIGQWVFLQGMEVPVNKFDFYPYTVNLNYQSTLLAIRDEILIVLLGPCSNILCFVLFVIVSWICQRVFGSFPDIGSKFIICFGVHCILDPFEILGVDLILRRHENLGGDEPIADAAKLYYQFFRSEFSGLGGIFITLFLYTFTCFASLSILYMYFLRLHNNGRMLDIYWRLYGDDEVFFVPYDLELSNQNLSWLCRRAEQWRGEEGERRKVAVYDYVWEEEQVEETVWDENGATKRAAADDGKKEITTHVSIHTLHLDGLRELYRHFLRLPDGAVVEVFGDLTVSGMDKDVKSLLTEDSKTLENLMGSQYSMNKLRGDRENSGLDRGSTLSVGGKKDI